MRVACWSDLHLDHGYSVLESLPLPEADVLIIAGDLAFNPDHQRSALAYLAPNFRLVIYVPGNHEYEGKDIHEYRLALKRLSIPGVHILDDGFVDFDGVRFIGSTLWTDCGNPKHQKLLDERIFNHWYIESNGKMFGAEESTRMHHKMVDYIGYQLSEARQRGLRTVVVSHTAPAFDSVHTLYLASTNNEAFYTDLRDFMELHEPEYWFHGHMHHNVRYRKGQTQVICNPLGHPDSDFRNPKFDPLMVVDL